MKKLLAIAAFILPITMTEAKTKADIDPENTLLIDLDDGQVVIEMYPDTAPKHVARIKELTKAGKEQTAAKIIEALGDLREFPFDAAMTLYTNLQIAQSMDVVHGEIAKENLETLYQLIQGLVEEGMSARLNYR